MVRFTATVEPVGQHDPLPAAPTSSSSSHTFSRKPFGSHATAAGVLWGALEDEMGVRLKVAKGFGKCLENKSSSIVFKPIPPGIGFGCRFLEALPDHEPRVVVSSRLLTHTSAAH